jgi:cytochrome d ubiquinol oxidase subunit II
LLDGYDLGLGTLMPFFAKSESDKRIIYGSLGPFWDGNEVWLITVGALTFGAFPAVYAALFSGLYSAFMLILFGLILRGVAVGYREEVEGAGGKRVWDICMFVGSFAPALLLGVAFANIFRGIPIDGDGIYQGTLLTLLNPYGLLGGLLFVMLFLVHGALWLAVKSEGDLQQRAASAASKLWIVLLIVAVVFLGASAVSTKLYGNYLAKPVLFIIPLLAVVALILNRVFIAKGAWLKAWFASGVTIVAAVLFGVAGLYPNLLPSSIDPAFSMTIYNSSSSPHALKIMLGVALTFVPIVIAYQVWAYYFFREKVTGDSLYDEIY